MQTNTYEIDNIGLSSQLRLATQAAHTNTEDASFIKKLFQGMCTDGEYYQYLWALHEVYKYLESAIESNKSLPVLEPIYFQTLFRLDSLKQDLSYWQSARVEIPETLRHEVHKYCQHIETVAKTTPHLLAAHAYVRHLGDLSGGQILGKVLSRRFPNSEGLNFYKFSFTNIAEMKQAYRSGLDRIGDNCSPQQNQEIQEEANKAFTYNGQIFQAISSAEATM